MYTRVPEISREGFDNGNQGNGKMFLDGLFFFFYTYQIGYFSAFKNDIIMMWTGNKHKMKRCTGESLLRRVIFFCRRYSNCEEEVSP